MARDGVIIDKKLEKVFCKTAFSKKYYRAGALCAVICASVALYTMSSAISSGAMISLDTPMFAVALIFTSALLLCLAYMAIVVALEKRSRRFCSAEGTVAANTLITETRLHLRVTRSGGQSGYSAFQTCLAYFAAISLFTGAVALGVLEGNGMSLQKLLSGQGVGSSGVMAALVIFRVAFVAFIVAMAVLCTARLFTEEGVSNVRVFVFPGRQVTVNADAEQDDGMGGSGHIYDTSSRAAGYLARDTRSSSDAVASCTEDAATVGYISCMLGSAEYITSLLSEGKQRGEHTSVVECIVSEKSSGTLQPVGR